MTTEAQDQKITTCDIDTGHGRITVVAEATRTPGLLITPDLYEGAFAGSFSLTHAATGRRIPTGWNGDELDQIRAVAEALGTTPVDWTGDLEAVAAQITEHGDEVTKARRDAKYPPVVAEPTSEPGGYPKTVEQATAEAVAKHVTVSLQHRTRDTWDLLGRKDDDGLTIRNLHYAALVSEWGLVHALREFAKVDPQVADHVARDIWDGWEDGSTTHEMVWDWAREYGLPELPEKDEPATETAAVSTVTTTGGVL